MVVSGFHLLSIADETLRKRAAMSQLIKLAGWSGQARGNIVFVHGLMGNAYRTWSAGELAKSLWPRWLAEDVVGLNAYTLSYEAPATNWLGTGMALQDRAVNVLEALLGEAALSRSPLIFVCHSLGGLLVKQVILDLQQQAGRRPEAAALLARVRQVVFIATPHSGSRQAGWLVRLRFFLWPTAVVRGLIENDPVLRKLNVDFRGFAADPGRQIAYRIFYETQLTEFGVIVAEASADPGLPGLPPVSIDADHISIAKPASRHALLYQRTRDFVADGLGGRDEPDGAGEFERFDLVDLPRQQSWNLLPRAFRLAAVLLVLAGAGKVVDALVFAPARVEQRRQAELGRIEAQRQADIHRMEQQRQVEAERAEAARREAERVAASRHDSLLAAIAADKGVPREVLVRHLVRLGAGDDIKPDDIPRFLEKFATEYADLRAQLQRATGDSAEIQGLRTQALARMEAGDLAGARDLLRAARKRLTEIRQDSAVREAELLSEEARIELLRLDYRAAAAAFAEAARLVAFDAGRSADYIRRQADALDGQGGDFGDKPALEEAIALWKAAAALRPRDTAPLDYGRAMLGLANSLDRLGERETDGDWLSQAVQAYRQALETIPRETAPDEWASVLEGLGNCLLHVSARVGGSTVAQHAVAAYEGALTVRTRDRNPVVWARTYANLGNAYLTIALASPARVWLDRAIATYQETLTVLTREQWPGEWAALQSNLGNALSEAGRREKSADRHEAAVRAYRAALTVKTRERGPVDWSATKYNLAGTLLDLGRLGDSRWLVEAVAEYREAISAIDKQNVPLRWATSHTNLGNALSELATRERSNARFEEALAAYREALTVWPKEMGGWALSQQGVVNVLWQLGRDGEGPGRFEEALPIARQLAERRSRATAPRAWASSHYDLGVVYLWIGLRKPSEPDLEAAIAAYGQALGVYDRAATPAQWARAHGSQGVAMRWLAGLRKDASLAQAAADHISPALDLLRMHGEADDVSFFETELREATALQERLRP
ncbi:tetratricopeptide repeat protein [Phreatobacter stygius]|uniref:Tetratricopeptide repeat protein n=1 Tax=Phreatobacter stygius TaxID=1940610 RepID=A0A4D7BAQ6_9HYPH|nr:tetratricopeptide repeat protein [Phreatobacter stygius]QCI67218.1 tetratricopeptide repeat protein [Phreatobacter stygius]